MYAYMHGCICVHVCMCLAYMLDAHVCMFVNVCACVWVCVCVVCMYSTFSGHLVCYLVIHNDQDGKCVNALLILPSM